MNVEPWSTVDSGEVSDRVRAIQYLLRARGHTVAADGHFGPATQAAVHAFQSARGLPSTGKVDPPTWIKLVVVTHVGATGDAVRAVQVLGLRTIPDEENLAVDGVFGAATKARVRKFQQTWGLTDDGIAGREVFSFATAAPFPWPLVKVGQTTATNFRVPIVQHLLRHHGSSIVADGAYGPLTGNAVWHWQQTQRATEISTTVGQLDWPALVATVHPGDHGEKVKAVQCALPGLTVDGVYGPVTKAAVEDLQQMFGGNAGIVDLQTWRAIIGPVFE
ncbi:MAG: peptidoglycan-binding protein [Micropruina sp.]|nr:MAG: peptidoglycan-binding protein [Micropruina sp.]